MAIGCPPGGPGGIHEKLEAGKRLKEEGNDAFRRSELQGALRAYHLAGLHLAGVDRGALSGIVPGASGAVEDEQLRECSQQLSLVRSNMAACYIQQKRYDRAIEACNQALRADASNTKALYRKAQAHHLRGDVYTAQDLLRAHISAHSDFARELASVEATIRERERASTAAMRGFLR